MEFNRAVAHEVTGSMTAYTKPAQDQTRHNPSMEEQGSHKVPPIAEKLLVIDG